jgi:hypothetical protein
MRRFTIAVLALLLVTSLVGVSFAQAPAQSSKEGQRIDLALDSVAGQPSAAAPWRIEGAVNLAIDDGSAETAIGIGGTWEFIYLNRFTPNAGDFPFYIDQVAVYFPSFGMANVGDNVVLALYENTSGNVDPAVGANYLASFPTTVQVLDDWSIYTLASPVTFNGPGDVLVGVVALETPGTSYWPAALDTTSTQQRSWAGWWLTSPPPDPPTLPPDDTWGMIDSFGFPGNWLIRASGQTMGGNTVHVNRVAGKWFDMPWGKQLRVLVEAVDQAGMPLGGVAVAGTFSLPDGSSIPLTKWTHANGSARFNVGAIGPGTYTFCVTNLTKEGYTYVPNDNRVTCRKFRY